MSSLPFLQLCEFPKIRQSSISLMILLFVVSLYSFISWAYYFRWKTARARLNMRLTWGIKEKNNRVATHQIKEIALAHKANAFQFEKEYHEVHETWS